MIKNKLFFFANYEKANKTYQNPYAINSFASLIDAATANNILDKLREMPYNKKLPTTETEFDGCLC